MANNGLSVCLYWSYWPGLKWRSRTTHAFHKPAANGSLQGLPLLWKTNIWLFFFFLSIKINTHLRVKHLFLMTELYTDDFFPFFLFSLIFGLYCPINLSPSSQSYPPAHLNCASQSLKKGSRSSGWTFAHVCMVCGAHICAYVTCGAWHAG